jgi:hypothetical protein
MMKKLAGAMNIKGHIVGNEQVMIHGPADIEVHKGSDGRFYVIDFARYMPPQTPKKNEGYKVLYEFLRPEFVSSYKTPLSPDAFSLFGKHDHKIHVKEVKEAYKFLLLNVIPKLAQSLDFKDMIEINQLTMLFHEVGVNMRQIGRVRFMSKKDQVKRILLIEALARCIKTQLRFLFRKQMKQLSVPSDDCFKTIAVDLFNLVVRSQKYLEKSTIYWKESLKNKLTEKYEKLLSESESDKDLYLLLERDDLTVLLKRVCEMVNIKLSPPSLQDLSNPAIKKEDLVFVISDFLSIDTKVKKINLIDYAEGMSLIYRTDGLNEKSTERLLSEAEKILTVTFFLPVYFFFNFF